MYTTFSVSRLTDLSFEQFEESLRRLQLYMHVDCTV